MAAARPARTLSNELLPALGGPTRVHRSLRRTYATVNSVEMKRKIQINTRRKVKAKFKIDAECRLKLKFNFNTQKTHLGQIPLRICCCGDDSVVLLVLLEVLLEVL
jgi:hypothetical protein